MLELLAVAAAGAAAGASNAIAGAGSLITFPTMVALGAPPLTANVTNTVGIVPASIGGALGYTDLLREQGERFARFLTPMLLGAVAGTVALLLTSAEAFEAIVPALIAASCLLLLFQPRLTARIAHAGDERSPFLVAGIFFCGAYGAYFGSAVSILLFAILALFVADTLQHLNAMKILLVGCANLLAAVAYAFLAPVNWRYALTIMVSSFAGGRVGAHYARRIPSDPLRISIAAIGLLVAAVLAVRAFG
ncbi:MAG TPA: sulfite exporter TauE/SafE family protein [Solirubrobacterales bacterium]|nr:sulfite exporter TauE/SafE family protein [Solirubrobacterales bacterium]